MCIKEESRAGPASACVARYPSGWAEMASIRRSQPLRPVRVMALVLMIGSLLATSCTADEAVTDLEARCQNVQCYTDCPSDSYLQKPMYAHSDESYDRVKRAIATNNHAHGPITIVPIKMLLYFSSNHQVPQQHRLKRHIDLDYTGEHDPQLQELCCPRCVCQPCPEMPYCPPNFKRVVDTHEQTGQPGNCCPSFQCLRNPKCYSLVNRAEYGENEKWNEGDCLECTCKAGDNHCEIPTCKPLNCEHQLHLPGRCCPVCDPTKSIFCEDHNCDLQCRNGYERRGNCSLCRCVQLPPPELTTEKTTETPVLMANFTSDMVDPDTDELAAGKLERTGDTSSDGDRLYNNWMTWGGIGFFCIFVLIGVLVYVSGRAKRNGVSIEKIKKGLQMLFSCNEISKRKSVYNRVSSTAPVTPPAAGTTTNSMA